MKGENPILAFFVLLVILFGCVSEQETLPDDCSSPPTLSLVDQTQSDCGASNGALTVMGTGGSGSLRYSLDGGQVQTNPTFDDLAAGLYTIQVFDENDCSTQMEFVVTNRNGLNIETEVVGTRCGENEGAIRVTSTGAQGEVMYKLNEGVFQNSGEFVNLAQGGYVITARDDSGCEVEIDVDVKTDVTFAEIELIIQRECVTSGCHDGTSTPDYRGASNIIGSAGLIRQRVANRSMPPDGRTITDAQIAAILCWVDDGASGN